MVQGHDTMSLGARILEKPETTEENLRMLKELNGKTCEVVTGVTVCECLFAHLPLATDTRIFLNAYDLFQCSQLSLLLDIKPS